METVGAMWPATGLMPRRNSVSGANLRMAKPRSCRPARRVALYCQAVVAGDRPGTEQAGKVRSLVSDGPCRLINKKILALFSCQLLFPTSS